MNRATRAVQRGASALGFKFEYGTAANRVSGDRFAGADASGAGEAKNVVRRKRDDFVMAASSALVAEVGKFALPVFFERHSVSRATKLQGKKLCSPVSLELDRRPDWTVSTVLVVGQFEKSQGLRQERKRIGILREARVE